MTRTFSAVLALGLILWGVTAAAQMAPVLLLRVDVPFQFSAGGMTLPAGQYDVYHVMNPNVVMIRSSNGNTVAVVHTSVTTTAADVSNAKLVFTRYGDERFLSEVWTEKDNEKHQCWKSDAERTLMSNSQKAAETIVLYAKR